MSAVDWTRRTAAELADALAAGETTSVELTRAHLDRIAEVDGAVHAFLQVDAEGGQEHRGAQPRSTTSDDQDVGLLHPPVLGLQ